MRRGWLLLALPLVGPACSAPADPPPPGDPQQVASLDASAIARAFRLDPLGADRQFTAATIITGDVRSRRDAEAVLVTGDGPETLPIGISPRDPLKAGLLATVRCASFLDSPAGVRGVGCRTVSMVRP